MRSEHNCSIFETTAREFKPRPSQISQTFWPPCYCAPPGYSWCPLGGAAVARCHRGDTWCCRTHQAVGTHSQEGEYTVQPPPSVDGTQVDVVLFIQHPNCYIHTFRYTNTATNWVRTSKLLHSVPGLNILKWLHKNTDAGIKHVHIFKLLLK